MSAAEMRRVAAVSDSMRRQIEEANNNPPRAHVGDAEVIPFPARRQRRAIEKQLRSVQNYDDGAAYRWLTAVARRHETRLRVLGVKPDRIAADVAELQREFGLS